jgi:hypothetical protein
MKYLILSKNNSTAHSIMGGSGVRWSEGPSNSTLIDASNMLAAKNILQKSLNRNNINEKFEIIDLVNSEKKHYVVKKKT